MSVSGVNGVGTNQYAYRNNNQKVTNAGSFADEVKRAEKTNFAQKLQNTQEVDATKIETYTEYLKSKYGIVTIQSIGKEQASLDRVGKSMSGNDVIIAPNILEQMANDQEKAIYYEQKIDYFFNSIIPRETALFAAKGLVFEPGGVAVHEDGTVTYISGCSDSPERVTEVNAINKAKREKETKQRKESLERSQEAAELRGVLMEQYNQKQMMASRL